MEIRMRERLAVLAALAYAAWLGFSGAEKELSEPEAETLLSNSAGTVKQDASRKFPGRNALHEERANLFVTVKLHQTHARNIWHVF